MGKIPLATEFHLRILYVSGLPTELQAFVVSDPRQTWYDPQLTAEQIEDFYTAVESDPK